MFEELTNEEMMEFDGGGWLTWVVGISLGVGLAAAVIAVTCFSGGAAAPAVAYSAELSTEFLTYMGVAALI